jgi:predicted Fe-Mo cluster-binding NifX family protein
MKVAVTAQQNQLQSPVDQRFGRAKYILVIDTQTNEVTEIDNTINLNAAQGAGIQTGQNIANAGVEAVITGNVGPNAFRTLNAAQIKIYLAQNQTVQQALDMFKQGKLQQVENANVQGHWT